MQSFFEHNQIAHAIHRVLEEYEHGILSKQLDKTLLTESLYCQTPWHAPDSRWGVSPGSPPDLTVVHVFLGFGAHGAAGVTEHGAIES